MYRVGIDRNDGDASTEISIGRPFCMFRQCCHHNIILEFVFTNLAFDMMFHVGNKGIRNHINIPLSNVSKSRL